MSSDRCDVPLGLEDGRLSNQFFTSSTFYNYYCAPRNARLHQRRAGRNGGAWCAKKSNRGQWLQMDFGALTRVTRIATQGRQNSDQWVTSYYVSYSRKGSRFTTYREGRSTKVHMFRKTGLVTYTQLRLEIRVQMSLEILFLKR